MAIVPVLMIQCDMCGKEERVEQMASGRLVESRTTRGKYEESFDTAKVWWKYQTHENGDGSVIACSSCEIRARRIILRVGLEILSEIILNSSEEHDRLIGRDSKTGTVRPPLPS